LSFANIDDLKSLINDYEDQIKGKELSIEREKQEKASIKDNFVNVMDSVIELSMNKIKDHLEMKGHKCKITKDKDYGVIFINISNGLPFIYTPSTSVWYILGSDGCTIYRYMTPDFNNNSQATKFEQFSKVTGQEIAGEIINSIKYTGTFKID
jgi:hypothetical protein